MGLILQRNTDVLTAQNCMIIIVIMMALSNTYMCIYILVVTVSYALSTRSHLIFTIILRGRHNTDGH